METFCNWNETLKELQTFFLKKSYFHINEGGESAFYLAYANGKKIHAQTGTVKKIYVQNAQTLQRYSLDLWKHLRAQTRNQEFFRAGEVEVSENKGTSINI